MGIMKIVSHLECLPVMFLPFRPIGPVMAIRGYGSTVINHGMDWLLGTKHIL